MATRYDGSVQQQNALAGRMTPLQSGPLGALGGPVFASGLGSPAAAAKPSSSLGASFDPSSAFLSPPAASTPSSYFPAPPTPRQNVTGAPGMSYGTAATFDHNNLGMPKPPASPSPLQAPGQNMANPGYGEQALEYTQNRLLEDPAAGQLQHQYQQTQNPSGGEQYMNQNLGTLDGPGQGDQYWNQVAGQFQNPMAGEQFARQATQNMSAQGPASAFYNNAMGQYDQFTGFQGGQSTQGQYGQTQQQLGNGSQGEQGLGQIAGQYNNLGQYNGANNAQGQYQQNAASGPLGAQQFYNQVQGQLGTTGTYSGPNLAAGQYGQTQQSFGALPTPDSADPFYDRAIQLGTQKYNSQAAGRGVYGSSDALSGVGNVITDLNAARAQNQFGNEMSIAQENRARQQLLGEQARQGDLSSLSAFGANLSGLETFGNLANSAGQQTLGQQTMLGTQARNADLSQSDAFNNNLAGASTFANINNQLGDQAIRRNELLGNLANQADSQALGAQNANIAGLNAFGNIAQSADAAETGRYTATTNAMNNADRTGLDRMTSGANIANNVDANNRADYTASNNVAQGAASLALDRNRQGADIAHTASQDDLARLNSFNNTAQGAEAQRQNRVQSEINARSNYSSQVQKVLSDGGASAAKYDAGAFEDWFNAEMAPGMQKAQFDQQEQDNFRKDAKAVFDAAHGLSGDE